MKPVKQKHPLGLMATRLGIRCADIARAYSCSEPFIYAVLLGKKPCPARLDALLRKMITARAAESARALMDVAYPAPAQKEAS